MHHPDMRDLDALMQDKLELHCRQQLSAMLDGALAPDQARFLLRRLQHDHELAGCWERWQVYGDLMRGAAPAILPADFSRRVQAALAGGEVALQQQRASGGAARPRWTRWAGGAALAASVAVAALFVTQRAPVQPSGGQAAGNTGTPLAAAGPERAASGRPGPEAPAAAPDAARGIARAGAAPTGSTRPPAPSAPQPAAPDAASAAAATVLAAAEAPRRGAARRNRARARALAAGPGRAMPAQAAAAATPPPAATRESAPAEDFPILVAAGADRPAGVDQAAMPAAPDLFVDETIAPARPWPRAILPGMSGSSTFTVDYGAGGDGNGFEPFQPRLPAEPSPH